jgi:hypothetical protein
MKNVAQHLGLIKVWNVLVFVAAGMISFSVLANFKDSSLHKNYHSEKIRSLFLMRRQTATAPWSLPSYKFRLRAFDASKSKVH